MFNRKNCLCPQKVNILLAFFSFVIFLSFLPPTTFTRCLFSSLVQIFASFLVVKHLMSNICLPSDFSSGKHFFLLFHLVNIAGISMKQRVRKNVHGNFRYNFLRNFSVCKRRKKNLRCAVDMLWEYFSITSRKNVAKLFCFHDSHVVERKTRKCANCDSFNFVCTYK